MSMTSEGGGGGSGSNPAVQLHKLCVHYIGGAGGNHDTISSHYRSGLQLLTSSASHGHSGEAGESRVVERCVSRLVRSGRDRDAAILSGLHSKLSACSKDILRNRASILTLLYSLSDEASGNKENQIPSVFTDTGSTQTNSTLKTPVLRSSKSISSGLTGYHPPLPPKPRSRPNSVYGHTETDSDNGKQLPVNFASSIPITSKVAPSDLQLVKELLYVFQGIEGNLIKYSDGKFTLSKKTSVPSHQKCVILKLCEVGWLYRQVHEFIERSAEDKSYGLVGHSFVTALREELTEYYRLLAGLEQSVREGNVSLLQLGVWTREPQARLKLLVEIVTRVGDARGGGLATVVYSYLSQGDPQLAGCVSTLLSACCRPLYTMLLRWLLDGSLEDPYNEFFINGDSSIQGEAIWHHKYTIRDTMIPKFLSKSWANKILSTGKSINFLHSVCQDSGHVQGRSGIVSQLQKMDPATLFRGEIDNPLLETVQQLYNCTARHVMDIMYGKFQLMSHLAALRKYMLLGQGDIMRYLLDLLEPELCHPATQLYPHNLAGILETAIRGSNSQYEDQQILERLDVRLLEIQAGDTGWDVFSLDYKVTGPIGVVFTPDIMTQYLMLFNTLWRAKRMEWVLSCTWKKLASLHKMARQLPELVPVLHLANLVASEMIHFIHQMAYYTTFEVMECGWDSLNKMINTSESLDEIIEAHKDFLTTLVSRALLDDRSRNILDQLRAIYDRILEFQTVANRIHDDAVEEWDARQTRQLLIDSATGAGEYGTTEEKELQDKERRRVYARNKLGSVRAQLKIVSQSYGDMVKAFLYQLTCSNDDGLQSLSFRLDFNSHYKKKDSRLSKPLMFSARKLSMSGHMSPMISSMMTSSLMSTGP